MHGVTRLAIDLGTSHTVAVVQRGDRPAQPLLFDGSPLLPSGVFAGDHGAVHTGRDAERLAQSAPHRFEPHPKRRIDEGAVLLGEVEVPVPDLLAAVLRRVLQEAGHAGAGPGAATVLTCPADWGRRRREILQDAARRAGIFTPVLVDEPVAAATYCVRVLRIPLPPGRPLLIFDFGGGTLDLALVRAEPAGARVVGVGGLEDLGGLDLDAAIVGHLGRLIAARDPLAWQGLAQPRTVADLRTRRLFWDEVRAAKEMLSRAAATPVHLPGGGPALHLTRDEVESLAAPLVDRAIEETRRVLERGGVAGTDLAGILLVGGSSRIPLVASRLHARLGVAPVVPEQPELPVALGALGVASAVAASVAAPTAPAAPAAPAAAQAAAPATEPSTPGSITGLPVSGAGPVPVSSVPTSGAPGAPVSVPYFDPGAPAQWSPTPPGSYPPGGAAPRRRGLVLAAAGAALVLLLGVGAFGFWWIDRNVGNGKPGAAQPGGSGGSGTASAGAAKAAQQSRPAAPAGYVWCEGDAGVFCPTKPVCYDADDDEIDCAQPHQTQLFAAGYLPGGGIGGGADLANAPEVKKGCTEAVMTARSLDRNRTANWQIYARWSWINGTNYFFCMAGQRDEKTWTGSVFRTD